MLLPQNTSLTDTAKNVVGEFELIILHPSHFLIDKPPMTVKHPTTREWTSFYTSPDGFLCDGSDVHLPAFHSRGKHDTPLNPILINFAAHIQLRRLMRQVPQWKDRLHLEAQEVLANVESLHEAVTWEPPLP